MATKLRALRARLAVLPALDVPFLAVLLALLCYGLLMLFSAGYAVALYRRGDAYTYIRPQLLFAALGLMAMYAASLVDYHIWHRLAWPVLGISLALLVVVLFMPEYNGCKRWIVLPGLGTLQPSEIAKFAVVVAFAHIISLNHDRMRTFSAGVLPFALILGAVAVLMLLEPHLSGTVLILAIGAVLMFVGGTGLYVDSVLDGYLLSDQEPDLAYRAKLEERSTPELYAMLLRLRPDAQVEKNNRNRVMRMLERLHDGDDATPGKQARYRSLRLGVSWPRDVLRERIDERIRMRLAQGMIEEVQGLLARGVSPSFLLGLGLEYRFITRYLTGEIPDKDDMLAQLAQAIRKFAKRQMTWFRRNPDIVWLDMQADPYRQALAAIQAFLEADA